MLENGNQTNLRVERQRISLPRLQTRGKEGLTTWGGITESYVKESQIRVNGLLFKAVKDVKNVVDNQLKGLIMGESVRLAWRIFPNAWKTGSPESRSYKTLSKRNFFPDFVSKWKKYFHCRKSYTTSTDDVKEEACTQQKIGQRLKRNELRRGLTGHESKLKGIDSRTDVARTGGS